MDGKSSYYSLWLESDEDSYFQGVVLRLSERYNGTLARPHITALPKIDCSQQEIFDKAERFAKLLGGPFTVRFVKYGFGGSATRCIFAVPEESVALNKINTVASSVFGLTNEFFHMSLLYADMPPEEKQKAVRQLGAINRDLQISRLVVILRTLKDGYAHWDELESYRL